jgi:hypothetical protein
MLGLQRTVRFRETTEPALLAVGRTTGEVLLPPVPHLARAAHSRRRGRLAHVRRGDRAIQLLGELPGIGSIRSRGWCAASCGTRASGHATT